jgi:hypothetical protein
MMFHGVSFAIQRERMVKRFSMGIAYGCTNGLLIEAIPHVIIIMDLNDLLLQISVYSY